MAPLILRTTPRRPKRFAWMFVALAALLAGIVGPPEATALYGNTSYFWPGAPVMIAVCWENPTQADATARKWVQRAVERNWARHARVNFTGWGTCTPGAAGLHILHSTNSRTTPGGYPALDGVTNGMELPLSRPQHEVRALALHEFGHALGFYHEEERPDYTPAAGAPAACAKQSWPNSDPQYYGAYDIDSVMSDCGQPASDPSTWRESLSAGDIAGVQTAYGRRIAGTLLSPRAYSLSANNCG